MKMFNKIWSNRFHTTFWARTWYLRERVNKIVTKFGKLKLNHEQIRKQTAKIMFTPLCMESFNYFCFLSRCLSFCHSCSKFPRVQVTSVFKCQFSFFLYLSFFSLSWTILLYWLALGNEQWLMSGPIKCDR